MIVYHGSNVVVSQPKLIASNRALDFGMGFYTTTNPDQARDFASKVVSRTEQGVPILNVYEIAENVAFPLCDVLAFDGPNDAWLDFVKFYNQLVFASDKALGFIRFLRSEAVP